MIAFRGSSIIKNIIRPIVTERRCGTHSYVKQKEMRYIVE